MHRLANKQDQANALDEGEIVQYLNVEELVNRHQTPCRIVSVGFLFPFLPACLRGLHKLILLPQEPCIAVQGVASKMDQSLKAGFDWLIKHIQVNMDELKTRVDYDSEIQRNKELRLRREKYERVKQKRELEK